MTLPKAICMSMLIGAAIAASGICRAAEPLRVESVVLELIAQSDVPARDPGVIEAISVEEGGLVKQGDLLVKLDTTEAELDVVRAQVELRIAEEEARNDVDVRFARKSLAVAEAELQRALDSVEEYPKSVSETELDRLRLTVERTRLEIEQAEHVLAVARMTAELKQNALNSAKRKLDRQTITAPIGGMIVQLYRREGEWVEPGQEVARLLQLDRFHAVGFVAVSELDRICLDWPVELQIALHGGDESTFAGRVTYISPEVDPVNDQVRIWAEVPNENMQLKPGMRGTLVVYSGAREPD